MIPNVWEFILLLFTFYLSIFLTPIFQSLILRMESFYLYPFICARCTNFWISMVLNIFYAYIFNPWFLLWGAIFSFGIAFMYDYTAKHQ